jgi:hypothetical protein
MDDRSVDAALALPAHLHDLVVIVFPIDHRFRADVAISGPIAGILLYQTAYNRAITVYLIHHGPLRAWMTVSW